MFFEVGQQSGALMGAFLWNTRRGQAAGGIRLRPYESVEEYICDGLRLATGMGRKNATTGLWWGGGKGVIVQPPGDAYLDTNYRKMLFEEYGSFLTSLRGCYVAAEDSGIYVDDVDVVYSRSRYTTCISPELGGSGNPSIPTAAGVVCGMEAALEFAGMGDLTGKRVAVQGCGNVGRPLMKFLLEKGVASIVASDPVETNANLARAEFGSSGKVEVRHVEFGDNSILAEDCDIASPCAWGATVNEETVAALKAKIVCGAANSQLADPNSDYGMQDRGIIYVPDFVGNCMGIVNCADEGFGRVGTLGTTEDPQISSRLGRDFEFSVYNSTMRVLQKAKDDGSSTPIAANAIADELAAVPHPLWGHRSKAIVAALVNDDWANNGPSQAHKKFGWHGGF
jgi:glutamate dehydrogenase/leucine dehydrogenase